MCIFFISGSKVIKGVKRSNLFFNWPKKSSISKCKNKSVIMFYMDRGAEVSTGTSSSDLPLRGQRRSKYESILNGKNNSATVFYMDRDAKVSTMTSSSDLPVRGQRSKKVKT